MTIRLCTLATFGNGIECRNRGYVLLLPMAGTPGTRHRWTELFNGAQLGGERERRGFGKGGKGESHGGAEEYRPLVERFGTRNKARERPLDNVRDRLPAQVSSHAARSMHYVVSARYVFALRRDGRPHLLVPQSP